LGDDPPLKAVSERMVFKTLELKVSNQSLKRTNAGLYCGPTDMGTVEVVAWYDNEFGIFNRIAELGGML
jgi:hypothetical protein